MTDAFLVFDAAEVEVPADFVGVGTEWLWGVVLAVSYGSSELAIGNR